MWDQHVFKRVSQEVIPEYERPPGPLRIVFSVVSVCSGVVLKIPKLGSRLGNVLVFLFCFVLSFVPHRVPVSAFVIALVCPAFVWELVWFLVCPRIGTGSV